MQYTENYHLKKPQMSDFASIEDISENMDTIDEELAAPTGDGRDQTVSFTDEDLDSGITSFPTFLSRIVSGMKLAKFLRDFKAGVAYVLHVGDLINNATCTESGKALDARMGKTLQDQITSLNDSLSNKVQRISLANTLVAWQFRLNGNISIIAFTTGIQANYELSSWISYIYSAWATGTTFNNYNTVAINKENSTNITVDPNRGYTTKYEAWVVVLGIAA